MLDWTLPLFTHKIMIVMRVVSYLNTQIMFVFETSAMEIKTPSSPFFVYPQVLCHNFLLLYSCMYLV